MGADPYWYYVPYEKEPALALERLRMREFKAGRYYPVMYTGELDFPLDDLENAPAPGGEHATMEEAVDESEESGTCSILDIFSISEKIGHSKAYVPKSDELIKYLGTDKPTREIIDKKIWNLWEHIGNVFGVRGVGLCITVYKDDSQAEYYFGGYTYD